MPIQELERSISKPASQATRLTLAQFNSGDSEAFTRAYPALVNFAGRLMGSQDGAADIVQTVLQRSVPALRKKTPANFEKYGGSVMPYLRSAIRNERINQVRKRKKRVNVEEAVELGENFEVTHADPAQDVEGSVIDTDDSGGLISDIRQGMSRGFSDAVLLVDLQGLSYIDTADAMGVPIGTVMSRLHRGRPKVRKILEERMG